MTSFVAVDRCRWRQKVSKETEAEIAQAIENAEEICESPEPSPNGASGAVGVQHWPLDVGPPTQAALILKLVADIELFHTPDETAYADVYVKGHRETYRVDSKPFEQLLKHRFYEHTSEPPTPEAVRRARESLEAKAQYGGPTREVYVRVGGLNGTLYVDLGDSDWNVIEIDSMAWRVTQDPSIRFCRSPGMLPLPMPETGESITVLRPYLNVAQDHDFVLIVAWLLAALRAGGPYPVLVLSGQQGSAKSTAAKILRELVDPNKSPVRMPPEQERDLFVAAKHAHLLAFDNLSSLSHWLSDSLCLLATGGGHSTRRYYTDDEETLFEAQRPVILNGIEQIVTRADLADRSIFITLEPISSERRLTERELRARFQQDRAAIFGALLTMMVYGLRALPSVKLNELPRMADFAMWATACEGAEWQSGTFELASRLNREETIEAVLDADPVAGAVLELLARTMQTMQAQNSLIHSPGWKGTASELLQELTGIAAERRLKDAAWPKTANALSNRLTRALPFLQERGVHIRRSKEGHQHRRIIHIMISEEGSQSPSASSASSVRDADTRTHKSTHNASPVIEEQLSVELEELPARTPGKIVVKLPKKRPPNT
jgi:hypothetical protein